MSSYVSSIDKQYLSNYLTRYIQDKGEMPTEQRMRADLQLPDPIIKQTMVITLRIPVTNLNTIGDIIREGQNMLREILARNSDAGLVKLINFISTVEIQPQS